MIEYLAFTEDSAKEIKQEVLDRGTIKIESHTSYTKGVVMETYIYGDTDKAEKHTSEMLEQGWSMDKAQQFARIYTVPTDTDFNKSMLIPVRVFSKKIDSCFECYNRR